ncbi:hypothetical protein HLH33_06325 [Gluconacetobacter diazotrophicus]|uniref:DUF5672 domain-containing protein n=1 Tax=Gluconacetobacter diazotrophicus TaxID=33996 RepID=A0A7W4I4G2_GLUDI|nr:DUF5672 family protein [Gluconacetobacter diazotrophicus]MBB2155927.1 hypothetical protein [Gluconacetobacter diazotrophicus]
MSSSVQDFLQHDSDRPVGITICAVDDITPRLAADALRRSCRKMRFDRAVLLSSSRPGSVAEGIEHIAIPPITSHEDYSRFMLHDLHRHIDTPHVLIVQWDGFVLDGSAWDRTFTAYDYIGAVWGGHAQRRVGNGGFSLRSRKLLKAVAQIAPDQPAGRGEDDLICRILAPRLESEFGILFAPEAVAHRFAYERVLPDARTFGFHGLFNLWRHLGDDELLQVIEDLPASVVTGRDFLQCMACCLGVKRFSMARAFVQRLSAYVDKDRLDAHFRLIGAKPGFAEFLSKL